MPSPLTHDAPSSMNKPLRAANLLLSRLAPLAIAM
ncbi:MAG: hypothetical protein ACI9S9_003884, partial [Planctomycetota bacterium]